MDTHTKGFLQCGPSHDTTEIYTYYFAYMKMVSLLGAISYVLYYSFHNIFCYICFQNKVFLLCESSYVSLCEPLAYNFDYTHYMDKASLPCGPSYVLIHPIYYRKFYCIVYRDMASLLCGFLYVLPERTI